MPKQRECPECGTPFADVFPRKVYKCHECEYSIPPRRSHSRELGEAIKYNPRKECVCCSMPGIKVVDIEGAKHLLCHICYDFSHSFTTRETFNAYRASGGAAAWLVIGKRIAYADKEAVTSARMSEVQSIPSLRRRPGSFQGGTPFGFSKTKTGTMPDADQQLTLRLIQTYLSRQMSLSAVARELVRTGRKNKHGEVSWSPSQVSFLARRENWI